MPVNLFESANMTIVKAMCICGRALLLQGDKVNIVKVRIRAYSICYSLHSFKYVVWLYLKESRDRQMSLTYGKRYISNSESIRTVKICSRLMCYGLKVGKTKIFPAFLLARKYYIQSVPPKKLYTF